MTTYPDTTPDWEIALLKGNVTNDWRQLNDAYLDVDAAITRATRDATFTGATLLDPVVRDELRFGPEGTEAPDGSLGRTLSGTIFGLKTSGHLAVGGVTPPAWPTNHFVIQDGGLSLLGHPTDLSGGQIFAGMWFDGAAFRAFSNAPSMRLALGGQGFDFQTAPAPSGGAGGTALPVRRMLLTPPGTLVLTPEAGQYALSTPGSGGAWSLGHAVSPLGAGQFGLVAPPGWSAWRVDSTTAQTYFGTAIYPGADNVIPCGGPSFRWTAVYAVNGTIQTSSTEAKQDVTPLDPADGMIAVRGTEPVRFAYKPPPPPPPISALRTAYDWRTARSRLLARPLEAAARTQYGFVLDDPAFPCDPRFQTGRGQSNPANTAGLLLAAIRYLDQERAAQDARISALEGAA